MILVYSCCLKLLVIYAVCNNFVKLLDFIWKLKYMLYVLIVILHYLVGWLQNITAVLASI